MSLTLGRRHLSGRVLAAGALALATAWAVGPPYRLTANDDIAGQPCSDRSLKGAYGLLASGVRQIPFGPNAGQVEMVVGTGMRTYDGLGGFTEDGSGLHGQITGITPAPGGIAGSYTVNPDCTGTSTFQVPIPGLPPIVSSFVIVDSGKQVKEAVMSPTPNVVTVILDRK